MWQIEHFNIMSTFRKMFFNVQAETYTISPPRKARHFYAQKSQGSKASYGLANGIGKVAMLVVLYGSNVYAFT